MWIASATLARKRAWKWVMSRAHFSGGPAPLPHHREVPPLRVAVTNPILGALARRSGQPAGGWWKGAPPNRGRARVEEECSTPTAEIDRGRLCPSSARTGDWHGSASTRQGRSTDE